MATFASSRTRTILLILAATVALLLCTGGETALASEGADLAAGAPEASAQHSPWASDSSHDRLSIPRSLGVASLLIAADDGGQSDPLPTTGECGAEGENVIYSIADDGTLTISGEGAMADYVNSSDSPFYNRSDIVRVVVQEGVTHIGDAAFAECRAMESIALPNSLASIGVYAFGVCERLVSIDIPDSVERLGGSAFCDCIALESIELPNSLTTLEAYMFEACARLAGVDVPEGVTTIEEGAFLDCLSLESVSLPETLTSVGEGAFADCLSLRDVKIPASVTSIGPYAFANCPNLQVTVAQGNPAYDSRDGCGALVETATDTLLAGSARSSIPNTIKVIGTNAFVEPLYFEEWLEYLGLEIEYPKKTAVDIPDGVQTIGDYAFDGCTELTSIIIPDSVAELGAYAFRYCQKLASVQLPGSIESIGQGAFEHCQVLQSIDVPEGVASIEQGAFRYCTALETVNLPGTLRSIGGDAFRDCTALTTVDIPEGVTTLGWYVFDSCTELETVFIPTTMTEIGSGAFRNTTAAIHFAGSRTQWAAITGSGKPAEPASYGSLSVVFDTDGGSLVATQNLQPGEKAIRPADDPTKDWCDFDGWFADEAFQVPFDFDTPIEEDVTIYAKWIAMCSVTFNSCGGSAVEMQRVWPGEKATEPVEAPTKEDRTFAGWYADEDFVIPFDFANTAIEADTTLYAKWKIAGTDEDAPEIGAAYAKFDSGTGVFTFFRSWDEYATNQTKTYKDGSGSLQTITYFADIETTAFAYSNSKLPAWNRLGLSGITTVVFEDDIAPISTAVWFSGMSNLESIQGIEKLDTSNVTDMTFMFNGCQKLANIDVSHLDVSNVKSFRQMFTNCHALTELRLSDFDTSRVTDMSYMFANCSNLVTLDVSGFSTSNVTDMSDMFYYCSMLENLDVSNFDTSNVTTMQSMFSGCSKLTELDVSGFITSNVDNMSTMFAQYKGSSPLDVSGFDTSHVTNMYGMFWGCSNITELDVSGFDTSSVTNMSSLFLNCESLTSLDVSGFDTSNVTITGGMFYGCASLTELDVSGFDTSKVTNMRSMFFGCRSLTALDVTKFDTSNVTDMLAMFNSCNALTSLDVTKFDTSGVTTMQTMFAFCKGLTELDVSGFDTSNVINMRSMFSDCTGLTSLDLSSFDTSAVQDMLEMFYGCTNLELLDISSFDTSKAIGQQGLALNHAFSNCGALKAMNLGEKTFFTEDMELSVRDWQLADLADTSVRYELLTDYDGSHPGWYVQGYGDAAIEDVADAVYTGAPIEPTPAVRVGDRTLVAGADYALSYANNTNAGTATVTITGIKPWAGSASVTFNIAPKAIAPTVTLSQASYTYDGKVKTPEVAVKDGSEVLSKDADYDVAYSAGRVNTGTYVAKVTLKGNYVGDGSVSFTINKAVNPLAVKAKTATVKSSKVRKKARSLAVSKVLKFTKKAQGKVTYKVTKYGKKAKKYIKVASNGKVTVKKGAKKGTYKVTVRITAAGNANYMAKSKNVTLKVKVK